MAKTKKHPIKKWEISFMKLHTSSGREFKVTRRIPELSIAETKIFISKKRARKQLDEWLN